MKSFELWNFEQTNIKNKNYSITNFLFLVHYICIFYLPKPFSFFLIIYFLGGIQTSDNKVINVNEQIILWKIELKIIQKNKIKTRLIECK